MRFIFQKVRCLFRIIKEPKTLVIKTDDGVIKNDDGVIKFDDTIFFQNLSY